jgi:dTDP-4-amino-4,6-dideoxygalactose transaminase
MTSWVPYVDLAAQHRKLERKLLAAVTSVFHHCQFVNGPEVVALESRIAERCGVKHAVAVGNGTDAIHLTLRGLGIGVGDEVITTPNSFIASAAAIALTGAKPVFVDVLDDHNIDPIALERAIGLATRAILVVHLRGRPARMSEIGAVAKQRGILVIEDCAQALGARLDGKSVGGFGTAGCFSFHPLKNLGGCGDGGIITTNDARLAAWLTKARAHGLRDRDHCDFFSCNSRLDTLQAAVLLVKLEHLDAWTVTRRETAALYRSEIADLVEVPSERSGEYAVYHTFVIETDHRDQLKQFLWERGVETRIHYPTPIHLEDGAKPLGYGTGDFPVVERQAKRELSLPIFPELSGEQKDTVVSNIRSFFQTGVHLNGPST